MDRSKPSGRGNGLTVKIRSRNPFDQAALSLERLKNGTPTQRAAYAALAQARLWDVLRKFNPTLAGTIPLDVDIPGSDLDVLCEVHEFDPFAARIQKRYGRLPGFHQKLKILEGIPSHIARFTFCNFPIEIVGQPLPVARQRAFRHMVAEAYLLQRAGEPARAGIRALKLAGLKTEPAFGEYFFLGGNPYDLLLILADSILQETFSA